MELGADGITLAGPTQKVADIVVDAATMSELARTDAPPVPATDGVASGP